MGSIDPINIDSINIQSLRINPLNINPINIDQLKVSEISIPRNSIFKIPRQTTIPKTKQITRQLNLPAIEMPCVEIRKDGQKNRQSMKDDPDGNLTINCAIPTFTPMVYNTKKKLEVKQIEAPDMTEDAKTAETDVSTPRVDPPPLDPPCPDPTKNNPRIGDLNRTGDEKVVGFLWVEETKTCVVQYEPTNFAEKYLPAVNTATTTFAITVVATTAATLTPFANRLLKPLFKQLIKKIKKLLGKKTRKLTISEKLTNTYRKKKGLPPLKNKVESKKLK